MNRAQQIRFEAQTLREFFNASDRQGLRLPEDSQDLRLIFDKLSNIERVRDANQFHKAFGKWPPNKLLSLMALAQHSGIPTRLIDWSWSAYVAAYFAASGSLKENMASPELAVWRVNLESIRRIQLRSSEFGAQPDRWPVRIVSAPAADNVNLRAQQELFTLHSIAGDSSSLIETSSENTVTGLIATLRKACPWILVKATLPSSEACELLSLLRQHGSHAASLFPTFSGVAEFITEQRRITASQNVI